jgi:hypothetical protein
VNLLVHCNEGCKNSDVAIVALAFSSSGWGFVRLFVVVDAEAIRISHWLTEHIHSGEIVACTSSGVAVVLNTVQGTVLSHVPLSVASPVLAFTISHRHNIIAACTADHFVHVRLHW